MKLIIKNYKGYSCRKYTGFTIFTMCFLMLNVC